MKLRWKHDRSGMLAIQRRASREGVLMQEGLQYDPKWSGTRKPETWTPEMRDAAAADAKSGWENGAHRARLAQAHAIEAAKQRDHALEMGRRRQARKAAVAARVAAKEERLRDPAARATHDEMARRRLGRPVVCTETGTTYRSAHEAASATGILRVSISKCLLGKRKSAGGYTWKFA